MKTASLIFGTRFFLRCPPNKHYTTTANRMGRSMWVSGYFRHWPFTCYSWVNFLLTAVKNVKASVERLARVAWRFCRAEYWAASARANGRRSREKHFSLLPSQSPRSFTSPAVLCSRPAAWRLPHVKTPFVQVFSFEWVNYAMELWRILKFYWESI